MEQITNLWSYMNEQLGSTTTPPTPEPTIAPEELQQATVSDPVDEPNIRSYTSRDWTNRKAKEAAQKFVYSQDPFDNAWARVLKAEGGYTVDTGGPTKYGISQNAYPHLDIQAITPEMARDIYRKDYYEAVGADVIGKINPDLAEHVADMAFNSGTGTAVKMLYKSVGMAPQKGISEELIQRLSDAPELIRDYSQQRLNYYASLAQRNPDKYAKYMNGWVNRVRNLNKELGYSQGMGDLYTAAKSADMESLGVTPILRPFAPDLPELTEKDRTSIRLAGQRTGSLYQPDPSVMKPIPNKPLSSVGDVLSATYNQGYYLNTAQGAKELKSKTTSEALEANLNSLGKQASAELRAQVMSSSGFTEGLGIIKNYFPEIKLPYDTPRDFHNYLVSKAQGIEKEYANLESGSWTNGIGEAANKLLHVIAGYLPGSIGAALSDPAQGGSMIASAAIGAATGGASLPAQAAIAAGTEALAQGGLIQPGVQAARGELGLESGFKQGALNTVTAAVSSGILQGLGVAISKLFGGGSTVAGHQGAKVAEELHAAAKQIADPSDKAMASMAVSEMESMSKMHRNNPFGQGVAARAKLDAEINKIAQDLAQDAKPRSTGSLPVYTGEMDKLDASLIKALGGKDALSEWEAMKKGFVARPMEDLDANPLLFKTMDEANAYLETEAGQQLGEVEIRQNIGASKDFYLTPKEDIVTPPKPEISAERPPTLADEVFQRENTKYVNAHLNKQDADLDKALENALVKLQNHPDESVRRVLAADEEVGSMLNDINTEKAAQTELFNCMYGEPDEASA